VPVPSPLSTNASPDGSALVVKARSPAASSRSEAENFTLAIRSLYCTVWVELSPSSTGASSTALIVTSTVAVEHSPLGSQIV
jgi:hypothetical protein